MNTILVAECYFFFFILFFRLMINGINHTQLLCRLIVCFASIVVALMEASPFMDSGNHCTLVFSSWYPFEVNHCDYRYYIAFAYQNIFGCQVLLINGAIDVMLFAIFAIINYQIKLLGHRLSILGYPNQLGKGEKITKDSWPRNEMIRCYLMHLEIMR